MNYKLVIAEKPSVAKSIADVIGSKERKDGFLPCKSAYFITRYFDLIIKSIFDKSDFYYFNCRPSLKALPTLSVTL